MERTYQPLTEGVDFRAFPAQTEDFFPLAEVDFLFFLGLEEFLQCGYEQSNLEAAE